jgi:hypothetical protein
MKRVGNVKIFDDFFPSEVHKEVWELMQRPMWGLAGGNPPHTFWHMDGLEKEEYFNTYLYGLICSNLKRKFDGIVRIYANGQTAGQCGVPHMADGDITLLYYPNPEWQLSLQGHLMMCDVPYSMKRFKTTGNRRHTPAKNDEILSAIVYKPNRAVMFPARSYHYADSPDRYFAGLRVSLAYKLLGKL